MNKLPDILKKRQRQTETNSRKSYLWANVDSKMTSNFVFEDLVKYIAKNGTTESIKPIFKTDDFCLYQENCLAVMARFPDNYVDMIFADPPYNLSNGDVTCYAGKMVSVNKGKWDKSKGFEADLEFHEKWISECRRILN